MINTVDLHSQTETATLSGRVVDAAGNRMSGATVQLQNIRTGLTRTIELRNQGQFRFELIPPSHYSLKASAPGFITVEDSLMLHVGDLLDIDITLIRMYELEGQIIEAERPRTTARKTGLSSVNR